jgi:hypothetical protein
VNLDPLIPVCSIGFQPVHLHRLLTTVLRWNQPLEVQRPRMIGIKPQCHAACQCQLSAESGFGDQL